MASITTRSLFALLVFASIFFGKSQNASCQVNRGAAVDEIFIQCPTYSDEYGRHYSALFHSTDNGIHLSLLHTFDYGHGGYGFADFTPGVLYNIGDSVIDRTNDYGITWIALDKPEGYIAASGGLPGELYVTSSTITSPDLFRSSDFGLSWSPVSAGFSLTNSLLDVGSSPGEVYALKRSNNHDTLELKYSNNYGVSFSSIFIDTSLIMDTLFDGVWFTRGTSSGEFYLMRAHYYPNEGFYVFHTIDNGSTFEYQSTLPKCSDCSLYQQRGISFSAGRAPGSFYYMRCQPYDSLGGIISKLCIDYSSDYGKTFVSNCYFLDSLYTTISPKEQLSNQFQLYCHPNPVSKNTKIHYSIARSGDFELSVFNLQGILQNNLVHSRKSEGSYLVNWDGIDDHGNYLPTGVYFITLKVDGVPVTTEKVVIIK